MENEIISLVNSILNEKFEIPKEKLVPDAHLKRDLNLDSLDFVDMIVLIEDKYSMGARDVDFLKIQTLGDIYSLVTTLGTQAESNQAGKTSTETTQKTPEAPL